MRLRWLVPATWMVLAACVEPPPTPEEIIGEQPFPPAPVVSSVSPDRGPAAGGTALMVTGSGFTEGTRLFLGDTEATEVVRLSENRLTAETPSGMAGDAVDVRVVIPFGAEARLEGAFTYDAAPGFAEVALTSEVPEELASLDAAVTVTLEAEARVIGATEAAGPASSLRAQVGFGPAVASPADFTWVEAAYVEDAGPSDRFRGSVALPVLGGEGGVFALAARFTLDDGATWAVATPLKTVRVRRPSVDWCKTGGVTTGPEPLVVSPGGPAQDVYAQVFHASLTEAPGAAPGIEVQLGVGAEAAGLSQFTWTDAAFNVQQGNNDEWRAALVPPATAGAYRYLFRARLQGGPWLDCDGDGTDSGFSLDQSGTLTVTSHSCTQQPLGTSSLAGGATLTAHAVTTGSGLRVQAGIGSGTPDSWGWADAEETAAGQWSLAFTPAYTGTRSVGFRASDDDGGTWWPCPPAQPLDVLATLSAGYCNLQYPATVTQAAAAGTVVYGQVYEAGLTEAPGASATITAELGYGKSSVDPGLAWTWVPAAYNVQVGNNDEYMATLPVEAAVAGMSFAFRFHLPGGVCHGDLDGNGRAFSFSGEASGSPNLGTVLP